MKVVNGTATTGPKTLLTRGGVVSNITAAAGTATNVTITFDEAFPTAGVSCVVVPYGLPVGANMIVYAITNVFSNGAQLTIFNSSSSAVTSLGFRYIAVGN